MTRSRLIAVSLIIIGVVFLISLLRSTETEPFTTQDLHEEVPSSYPEVVALEESTANFNDVMIEEEPGEAVKVQPQLAEDAYAVCSEYTCIGTIEVFEGNRFVPLEGHEINITSSGTDAFVLEQLDELPRPFRIEVQVLDRRAKVISKFYSQEFT